MGRSKTITREQIEEILAARSRGEKPRDTAKRMGISTSSVTRHGRQEAESSGGVAP